jgi:hypothetical protein
MTLNWFPAAEKLEMRKSPNIAQILAELSHAGSNALRSEIHKLINSVWNTEGLPQQWKESSVIVGETGPNDILKI